VQHESKAKIRSFRFDTESLGSKVHLKAVKFHPTTAGLRKPLISVGVVLTFSAITFEASRLPVGYETDPKAQCRPVPADGV
jgi:hypothetical protein